ncbi:transcription termination factor Rho [Glycomyces luteolus]|uniref:Transcription termination factor Rho n=1 Tax=Glycomyces luteolus TaxID=2670330 RepID=A0A9X3P9Z6_9ACTN|nr:transcription termination factor Rho [Glycomyces luteolus]MDA1361521.1 transcription termination factor Rho [Glycomyces luteolus]
MSDTTGTTSDRMIDEASDSEEIPEAKKRRRAGTGLASMLMPELQQMAQSLGITGVGRMRKSELIAAIQERQDAGSQPGGASAEKEAPPVPDSDQTPIAEAPSTTVDAAPAENGSESAEAKGGTAARRATRPAGPPQPRRREERQTEAVEPEGQSSVAVIESDEDRPQRRRRSRESGRESREGGRENGRRDERPERVERSERSERAEQSEARTETRERRNEDDGYDDRGPRDGEGDNRRRKRRDRSDRRQRGGRDEAPERGTAGGSVQNDEQLVPVAGILDILDNYAFIRTTGYLAGPDDVYVSMSQVRKYRLRRGDAITGAVKPSRGGGEEPNGQGGKQQQRREKYNPLVRLDTVNGMSPDDAKKRDEFYKLTPLYPQERLRLETEPNAITTRVIDLVAPIGKGQRALIVSPPKAGKTMVLQAIANAITTNNPECHLMVVLADERPEEVTDMQRSVKGEVIASTFDRPPSDHTTVAELAIERAKRLVELGHDVVVLLDSITRLGRAYNNSSPASGRILSGGIDSTALYPPKRFLGAARNIEHGGSLTIIGTALVETGSMGDTVIFEEFKGTGNAELKLDRKIAEKRTWPAIDVHQSSTRKDELMMSPEEQAVMLKLRRVLSSLDPQQAIDLLIDRLKKTQTNAEFLMQIVKNTPGE